jgi:glycosyltransferase involved in cell wall biosynthesis
VRVLFLYFGPLRVNSAIQAFHFGQEMTAEGIEVVLCGVGDPRVVTGIGEPSFDCVSYEGLRGKLRRWAREPQPTMVCAWTPRELVRKATERATRMLDAPYVVHLEDNEEFLLGTALGRPYESLQRLPDRELDRLCGETLINPGNYPGFLAGAAGITVITAELNEFNRAGRPWHVARPGVDPERLRPDLEPAVSRESLGLRPEDFVLVYHGIGHYANQHDLLSLYLSVKLLQRRGRPVKLVRLGATEFGGPDPAAFRAIAEDVPHLGDVPWRDVPGYLALADAYVQPGAPDDFNRYRLPSKLPEFLAMGRPVLLPRANIGNDLTDGENALLLDRGDAQEIADRVELLLDDPALAGRLAEGARRFALEQLSWKRNSQQLAEFYRELIAARTKTVAA